MCFFTRLFERIKAFFLDDEYDRSYDTFTVDTEELPDDGELLWDDADFDDESCALEVANVELPPVKKTKKKKSKKKTVKKASKSKKKAAKKK